MKPKPRRHLIILDIDNIIPKKKLLADVNSATLCYMGHTKKEDTQLYEIKIVRVENVMNTTFHTLMNRDSFSTPYAILKCKQ